MKTQHFIIESHQKKLTIALDEDTTCLSFEVKQPTRLKKLTVKGDNLPSLPPELAKLTALKSLKLQCPAFKALPAELNQLADLQCLHLTRCFSLEKLEIGPLENLKHLIIRQCRSLDTIPPETFEGLANLEFLLIDQSPLPAMQTLPATIGQLARLREFLLADCLALEALPPEFGDLAKLQIFALYNCPALKALPPAMGRLVRLEQLYLENCDRLETIPPEIGQLAALRELYLWQCNALQTLPDEIGHLNLSNLDLGGAQLAGVPATLNQLHDLAILRISSPAPLNIWPLVEGLPLIHLDISAGRQKLRFTRRLEPHLEILPLGKTTLSELFQSGSFIGSRL